MEGGGRKWSTSPVPTLAPKRIPPWLSLIAQLHTALTLLYLYQPPRWLTFASGTLFSPINEPEVASFWWYHSIQLMHTYMEWTLPNIMARWPTILLHGIGVFDTSRKADEGQVPTDSVITIGPWHAQSCSVKVLDLCMSRVLEACCVRIPQVSLQHADLGQRTFNPLILSLHWIAWLHTVHSTCTLHELQIILTCWVLHLPSDTPLVWPLNPNSHYRAGAEEKSTSLPPPCHNEKLDVEARL